MKPMFCIRRTLLFCFLKYFVLVNKPDSSFESTFACSVLLITHCPTPSSVVKPLIRGGPSTFGTLGKLHSKRFSVKSVLQLPDGILHCKAAFLSNKHNNDRNDEHTLIKEQNHLQNVTS